MFGYIKKKKVMDILDYECEYRTALYNNAVELRDEHLLEKYSKYREEALKIRKLIREAV